MVCFRWCCRCKSAVLLILIATCFSLSKKKRRKKKSIDSTKWSIHRCKYRIKVWRRISFIFFLYCFAICVYMYVWESNARKFSLFLSIYIVIHSKMYVKRRSIQYLIRLNSRMNIVWLLFVIIISSDCVNEW